MLIIRQEQRQVLSDYMYKRFVDDMTIHLRTNYTKQVEKTRETDLRKMIEDGIEKAEQYEVVTVTDVTRYLEYMVTLGQHFDVDSQIDWVGQILRTKDMNGTEKMNDIGLCMEIN